MMTESQRLATAPMGVPPRRPSAWPGSLFLWDRWRYELRMVGIGSFVLPLAIVAIYLTFSLFARYGALQNGGTLADADFQMGRGLLALLENGLALGAGLIAAGAVAPDRALELHLAAPANYRVTVLQRLGVVTLWSLIIGGITCATISATTYWVFPVTGFDRQLVWLPSVLCFMAIGAAMTVLLRSRVAASTILGILWIAQFLLKSMFLDGGVLQRLYLFASEQIFPAILQVSRSQWYDTWLQNRLILLGVALGFFVLTALALSRPEHLLGAEK